MANGKKLVQYTGSQTAVSIPTAVNNTLVREIASTAFASTSVKTIIVDTYANDISVPTISGVDVVWNKEPKCTIEFNSNGGSGTMDSRTANIGIAYTIPNCEFVPPASNEFRCWAINGISGATLNPGQEYAFASNTELYALWRVGQPWKDNDKSTWAEANNEGWLGSSNTVNGFSGTINQSSYYNIPKTISGKTITTVASLSGKSFVNIGGRGIIYISSAAFQNCSSLNTVSFPECQKVVMHAFERCVNLSSVYFPNVETAGHYAFAKCGLIDISLPNCKTLDWYTFMQCSSLQNVYLPKCSYLGYYDFKSCINLSGIDLPACTFVSRLAFEDCWALSYANLPQCSYIGESAFSYCSKLAEVSIPVCSTIAYAAFSGTALTNVVLPNNISYVGGCAFNKCLLDTVTYRGTVYTTPSVLETALASAGVSFGSSCWGYLGTSGSVTVSFKADFNDQLISTQTVRTGTTASSFSWPSSIGDYVYQGYMYYYDIFEEEEEEVEYWFEDPIYKDTTVYGYYEEAEPEPEEYWYEIIWLDNSGTGYWEEEENIIQYDEFTSEEEATYVARILPTVPSGYDFNGWYLDEDMTEPVDWDNDGKTLVWNGSTTFFGKFTRKA